MGEGLPRPSPSSPPKREAVSYTPLDVYKKQLLPGACLMAHRLRSLTSRIDEVVAAQLWLEIRSFPWQRQRKVAANIVMNTRRGVLRELGVGQSAREADPTWARSLQCDPDSPVWAVMESRQEPQSRSAAELADVLAWALERSVIDETDRDLLLTLAEVADLSLIHI